MSAPRAEGAHEPLVLPEGVGVGHPVARPGAPAIRVPEGNTQAFPEVAESPILLTAETPVSTFSIDVDTASWAMVRNALRRGQLPPEGAGIPRDGGGGSDAPFATHLGVMDSPWRAVTRIVYIGLQGMMPAEHPAMNLVFLIDTSGSMHDPAMLPLLIQSFRLMLGQLSADGTYAIVTYSGSADLALEPTKATERQAILTALEGLRAGGGTAGPSGLQQADATAARISTTTRSTPQRSARAPR